MAQATIKFNVFDSKENADFDTKELCATLCIDDCEENQIVNAWAKQAMIYAHQFNQELPGNLHMIDGGCEIIIKDYASDLKDCINEEDGSLIEITHDDRMRIQVMLDFTHNAKLIGGLATPSVISASKVAEALTIAMREASI